jgi:hypothetical protein
MKSSRLRAVLRGTLDVKRLHWAGRLGLRGRLRMWAERALLPLPAPVVLSLFVRTAYRKCLPGTYQSGLRLACSRCR